VREEVISASFGALSYGVQGAGEPVILVHASGMGAERWGRFAELLATAHTVYTPNLLGYGDTRRWVPDGYSIADEVKVVQAMLDVVGAPAGLLGHSFGGAAALYTALAEPERVRGVVLYEPTVFGLLAEDDDPAARAEVEAFTQLPGFLWPSPNELEAWLGRFVEYWSRAPVWAISSRSQKDALLAVGPKVVAEVREVLTGGLGPAAAALAQPALIVCGERSTAAAKRMAQLLADLVPNATLATTPRLGHMAPLHRPEPIVEHALRFFAALP
jgi:pimeloyl-ACP methyl ester carboxylesterase